MTDATSISPSPSRGMQRLTGYEYSDVRKVITMGTPQKWMGMIVIVATLLLGSAIPGHTDRGGHGGGGHGGGWHGGHRGGWHGGGWHGGHRGGWHGGGWWGGPRVGIGIGIGPYWGPYWGGYWRPYAYAYPYGYPPVVTVPSTQLYVQPSAPAAAQPPPPVYWYYCDDARGYYPYVQQCPGGWRAVAPTPQ
jgi:hypothetical protein